MFVSIYLLLVVSFSIILELISKNGLFVVTLEFILRNKYRRH